MGRRKDFAIWGLIFGLPAASYYLAAAAEDRRDAAKAMAWMTIVKPKTEKVQP